MRRVRRSALLALQTFGVALLLLSVALVPESRTIADTTGGGCQNSSCRNHGCANSAGCGGACQTDPPDSKCTGCKGCKGKYPDCECYQ